MPKELLEQEDFELEDEQIDTADEELDDEELEDEELEDDNEDNDAVSVPSVEELDSIIESETLNFQKRLEQLGAEFDSNGNFVRWVNDTPPTEDQDPLVEVRQEMNRAKLASIAEKLAKRNPRFEPYLDLVIQSAESSNIPANDKSVMSLFYWALGQGFEVELAKELKKYRESSSEKVEMARQSLSETGSSKRSGKVKVTAAIREQAEAWGLDPVQFAKKLEAARKEKK